MSEEKQRPKPLSRAQLVTAVFLPAALAVLAGVFVTNPEDPRRIYVGSYTIQVPEGETHERIDTGKYRLLLERDENQALNKREIAIIASGGLVGDLSPASMVRKVAVTGWFPQDTRVCLADVLTQHYGQETWAVQYYRQTYFDGEGLPYRERHGVLVIRNRRERGQLIIDVSRMDSSPALTVIDWEPVRAYLRTLLRNTEPSPDQQPGAWADGRGRAKALWAQLLLRPKDPMTPSPLDALPPRSTPVCLGAYQLKRDKLDQQPVPRAEPWARFGGYRLTLPGGAEARVTYRARPLSGKDLVGFQNLRPLAEANWLLDGECVRGLDVPVTFHNKRGAKQRYERFSKDGRRYVGVLTVVATKTPGNLIFDVSYPWPVDKDVDWAPLEAYLDDLRTAVIVGDYTAPDQGGERDRGADFWPCAS